MSQPQQPRRARHLLDPDNPRPPAPRRQQKNMHIDVVQRYVLSVLAATTILHLAGGLVLAALVIEDNRTSQVGLCVLGGAFGVLAVVAALAIHRRSLLSPWLLLGTLPGVIGLWLVYR